MHIIQIHFQFLVVTLSKPTFWVYPEITSGEGIHV
jgi:hypothetical protein